MRKAKARKAQYISIPSIEAYGYHIPLENLPVATENIFTNYDESNPAIVEFTISSGSKLKLIFPAHETCYLVLEPKGKPVKTPSAFKKIYNATIGFVPVLGPVEHNEPLYQKEAARLALLTHRASRNFRNIWYHYPENFNEFRELINSTWPGMDIEEPEVDTSYKKPVLHMFCPEERYPREIFWAGFGFQVWCQMLTYIVRAENDSLLIIDEPDIYLHSDLQRQLVDLLKQINPNILIATHSTEIISEADSGDLLIINKKAQSAKRIKNQGQLQSFFGVLGSNLNPTLTQLAKSKRAVFVEGKDFKIVSAFCRKIGYNSLANRSDFAVIPVKGFNPNRVLNFSEGIELTLGTKILKAIVFDRDFRPPEEISQLNKEFNKYASTVHLHSRKEIENFLLVPSVLDRTIEKRIFDRASRNGMNIKFKEDVIDLLMSLSDQMKSRINAQFMSKRGQYLKAANPSLDYATINERMLDEFDELWTDFESRMKIVPGKDLFAKLNEYLQTKYSISITHSLIVNTMRKDEIPSSILDLLKN